MKKVFVTRLIGLLILLINCLPVCAQRFESNGIYYVILGDVVYIDGVVDRNYKGDMIIPSEVTYNGKSYSVTIIVQDAFRGCSSLTSITLPPTLTFVSDNAFNGCTGLNAVYISDLASFFKINYELDGDRGNSYSNNPLYYAGHLFLNGAEIRDLEIPNNVTKIPLLACVGWSALNSLKIPNSVTSIGYFAFSGCTGLTTITSEIEKPFGISIAFSDETYNKAELIVPKGTKAVYQATEGWNKFAKITETADANTFIENGIYYKLKSDGSLEVKGSSTTNVDIPSSIIISGTKYRVTSIGAYAFKGRSDITYLSIPYSIKSIGEYAFMDCGSSITVNIADPESWCQMQLGNEHASPLSSAGKMLVHDIETSSFEVPSTVTSIGAFTFYQCSCLKSLSIPGTVTSIGSSAFEDCDYLTSLSLGEGLKSIGGSAFEGCKRLANLVLPSTVNSILMNAFKNCVGLTDVYCKATNIPNTDAYAFDGSPIESATLHVPVSAINEYRDTWPWSGFGKAKTIEGKGDVNGDGVVNDADVKDVARFIMGKTPTGFNKDAADVNNDNKVNAADIVLINSIKSK